LMLVPISVRAIVLMPFFIIFWFAVLAHFANIVDEIGPENRDELPRPLRNLGWMEDLAGPLWRFGLSLGICYAPAAVILGRAQGTITVSAILAAAIGSMLFPAILLTTTTSGSILNLRPDRLARVMRACGGAYLFLVCTWVAAAAVYVAGFIATSLLWLRIVRVMLPLTIPPTLFSAPVAYGLLVMGIVLMHGFCWHLGLQYRFHHHDFGWVFQFHEHETIRRARSGFEVWRNGKIAPPAVRPLPAIQVSDVPLPPHLGHEESGGTGDGLPKP
jgi:hypothetical protein